MITVTHLPHHVGSSLKRIKLFCGYVNGADHILTASYAVGNLPKRYPPPAIIYPTFYAWLGWGVMAYIAKYIPKLVLVFFLSSAFCAWQMPSAEAHRDYFRQFSTPTGTCTRLLDDWAVDSDRIDSSFVVEKQSPFERQNPPVDYIMYWPFWVILYHR